MGIHVGGRPGKSDSVGPGSANRRGVLRHLGLKDDFHSKSLENVFVPKKDHTEVSLLGRPPTRAREIVCDVHTVLVQGSARVEVHATACVPQKHSNGNRNPEDVPGAFGQRKMQTASEEAPSRVDP